MPDHWLEITLQANRDSAELLQDALTEAGALALTLQELDPDRPIFEPAPGETPLWQELRLTALFTPETDPGDVQAQLHSLLGNHGHTLESRLIEDRDWVRAWMEHARPMCFGRRLWVCPGGMEPATANDDAILLQLDPGLAFGTGNHPSTALCLDWLDGADVNGAHVIDYGCGSGLLGIAALRLGAAHVTAVDIDPQALTATRENARRNGVADRLETHGAEEALSLQGDIVLANILAPPLIALAPLLTHQLRVNGRIVLAGILTRQATDVIEAYRPKIRMQTPVEREGWVRLDGIASAHRV